MASVGALARCCACGREMPEGYSHPKNRRCRECKVAYDRDYYLKHRQRMNAASAGWREAHPQRAKELYAAAYERDKANGKRHARNLAIRGLTVDQYDALMKAQGGVCAICGGRDRRRLNVDHDHETGEVRGLLCSGCNGAKLGRLGHDVERMETRAEFLEMRAAHLRRAVEYLTDPPARGVI